MTSMRKHPLAKCEECPLQSEKCAPTSGPENAKIALVSRSPGYYDAKNGKPFTGPSGKVLDFLLGKYGVKRDNIIVTNMVLCETDDPPKEALEACRPRLLAELANTSLIIAAGSEAVNYFTRYRSIHNARGFEHFWNDRRVVATSNPALVLRKSDSFPDLVADFRLALDPLPAPTLPTVEIIDDPLQARAILRVWTEKNPYDNQIVASDLEWRNDTDFVCAGFSRDGKKSVVFGNKALTDNVNRDTLRRFYEDRSVSFLWHNGKSDTKVLRRNGIRARVDEDTFLLSYALDEEPGRHALEYCLMTEFGWPNYEPDSVKYFKKTGQFDFYSKSPQDIARAEKELYEYNGWDAAGTRQLFDVFKPRAIEDNVWERPYTKFLLPASEAFLKVEMQGFPFDAEEACNLNEREVLPRLWGLREKVQKITEHPLLSVSSPKQMAALYYDEYGLKHSLRDTNAKKLESSTGVEVRKEIIDGRFKCKPQYHDKIIEVADAHQEFAEIFKQKGNYIEGLVIRVGSDGKLYSSFNVGGTVTGRTSSRGPNFQNITREGRRGIQGIRTLFRPSEGCAIVQADFSQAELRTCAVLSGEQNLIDIYSDSKRSLHKERAAAFYGDSYTKEQYVKSKNINFGVTYGQSASAFAQMYHMDEKEAQAYIDSWWRQFPVLRQWVKSVHKTATTQGHILSPFGHKRRFHLITKENLKDVEREAVNFLPQNIAGWLTICALIELVNSGVPVISTVHDSLIADVPLDELDKTIRIMKYTMELQAMAQLGWELPFTVDVSVSTENWASVSDYELEAVAI